MSKRQEIVCDFRVNRRAADAFAEEHRQQGHCVWACNAFGEAYYECETCGCIFYYNSGLLLKGKKI